MSQARGCDPAHVRRSERSPWHLGSFLLALSLLHCESLIGIDPHRFGSEHAGALGGGGSDLEGGDGGDAGNGLGAAGRSASSGGGGVQSGGQAGQAAGRGAAGPASGGESGNGLEETDGGPPVDALSPEVVAFSPDGSSAGVNADEPIRIEFSESMAQVSVEGAYTQSPGRPTRFEWTQANRVLTVSPGLDRPTTSWVDGVRPGDLSELVVTYRLDGRAQDQAGNPLASQFSASYALKRRVEHRLSPCLDLSGTASAAAFEPASPAAETPCVVSLDGPVTFQVGDSGGEAVVAVLSYSLRHLPAEVELVSAVLVFSFDEPIGMPHALYGTLWLEQVELGAGRLPDAFEEPALLSLGVLSEGSVRDPRKDVHVAVARALEDRRPDALVQFRVRFEGLITDKNVSPDYVRLGGAITPPPALWLSYDCARCP
jgi:hypothetical protein